MEQRFGMGVTWAFGIGNWDCSEAEEGMGNCS